MRTDLKVVVFGSPMAVGHVLPLMPLAARLVADYFALWAYVAMRKLGIDRI